MYSRSSASLTRAILCVAMTLGAAATAQAQTENVIYSFKNPPDAFGPQCNLVVDAVGNMYGTTFSGGVNNLGSVFMVTAAGKESVVYSFAGGADGSHPIAGLFWEKKTGNLYGTTLYGGTANSGTVFMVTPAGVEKVLYSFKGGVDGANPYSSVVKAGGNIFGTTNSGGAYGYGTVFKLAATSGKETILHSFNSAFPTLDGAAPYAGLVLYKGLLYGTTTMGGASNLGTVFSISKSGSYNLLYSFKGGSNDGQYPYAGVAFDKSGVLYGTTYSGGTDNAGVVYKLAGGSDSVLHHFLRNGSDSINPYGSLIFVKGNFYGTTTGGNADGGSVYKITPAGTHTLIHSFTGAADGYNTFSAVVLNGKNTFYGTTLNGGASKLGTIFEVVP